MYHRLLLVLNITSAGYRYDTHSQKACYAIEIFDPWTEGKTRPTCRVRDTC